MKNILFLIGALCFIRPASAQEITLKGTVKDSTGTGIEMANVMAINSESQVLESYGITNHEGLYKLALKAGKAYTVKVSYLGFEPQEFVLMASTQDMVKDVVMREQVNQLDEVELTYEMPISVKGDTLVYNTDSFVTGTEKKLKDVLENLPGVEINDEGQIQVEGKQVTKVMVEGKDFFDGDSKLASENIPANALDKIEVLRNFNEVSQMKGLTNDQDNVAINIRLKEGKKSFWFGEVTAGAGTNGSYLAHPKLFYYSPKYSINIITDMNNIGEAPFTRRDYMNFTGGFRTPGQTTGATISIGDNGLGISTAQNNRAKAIDTKFAAVNFSYSPTEKLDLSGFGIYSYTGTEMEQMRQTTYLSSNVVEQAQTLTDQTVHLGLAKLSALYKPSDRLQVNYDVLMKQSDDEELVDVYTVASITDEIHETKEQKPITVTQNVNAYYTSQDSKHVFALESQYVHQDEDPFYNAMREEFAFVDLFPVDENQSEYNLNQDKRIISNKADAKLDYYWVTSPKSNLNFTLGTTQSHQNFNSNIYQILDDGYQLDMTGDEYEGDVTHHVSDAYLAAHFKFITGIFTFNPGVTLHQFNVKNTQLGTTETQSKFAVLPDVFINAQFKKSENLRFNYRIARSFTDVGQYAEALVLSNYNRVYTGNRDLESALNHNLSLNFFSFNMFNFTNIFANVTYTKRIDALKSNNIIQGINVVGTTINSNFTDESLSGNARYQRTFGKLKASVGANASWSKTNNLVQGNPQVSESFNQNYNASLASNFSKWPNLELGYHYTVNNYDNGGNSTTYFTNRPYVALDAAFLKGFILTADYDYYHYKDKTGAISNEYGFLGADLSYQKKDSHWEFGIKGTNLLNTEFLNTDSNNELFFTTSSYTVMPRYVLLRVKYDL